MNKTPALILIGISLVTFSGGPALAATITGTSPVIHTGIPLLDAALSQEIGQAFEDAIAEANDTLSKYSDQQDLATGFGNANVYSSQVATFQGFQNYTRIALTSGVMIGVQAPSMNREYYEDIEDSVRNTGDLFAGLGAAVSFLNVGINAGFIRPGLYLSLKFGGLSLDPTDEVSVSNFVLGAGVNYALIKPVSASSLFRWRGLSVGTGLIYHKSKVTFKLELDKLTEEFRVDNSGYAVEGELVVDPSVNLALNVKTLTIPFDITSSTQLLWLFNLTLGAGLDLSLGKTDILVESGGSVTVDDIEDPDGVISEVVPGTVLIDGSTKGVSPSFCRLRLMTGVGFNLGPAKIDLPITYYPKSGASVGVTAGVVL